MGRQASHILMTARFLESIVQELYRRKGGVLLHNKYLFQIGGIAEPEAIHWSFMVRNHRSVFAFAVGV